MTACNICSLEHCQASFFNGDDIVKDFRQLQRVIDQVQECVGSIFCEKLEITYCGVDSRLENFGIMFKCRSTIPADSSIFFEAFEYQGKKGSDIASDVVQKIRVSSYPIDNRTPYLPLTHTPAEKARHEKILKELANNYWCGTTLPNP